MLDIDNSGTVEGNDASLLMEAIEGGGGEMSQTLYLPRSATINYDFRDQMVRCEFYDDGTWLNGVHEFHYDCFGRRIRKIVGQSPDGPATEWSTNGTSGTGMQVRYIHGGPASAARWQVLEEYSGPPGGTPAQFALLATLIYGNYIDETLTMRWGGVDFYYNHDDQFSTTSITAGPEPIYVGGVTYQPGQVVERYDYGDFGSPKINGGLWYSTLGNTRMFTGREWDAEIEMYHYRTRSMLPDWGRFTTRDTIGTWSDWQNFGNGNNYVGAGPYIWLDPYGEYGFRDWWDDTNDGLRYIKENTWDRLDDLDKETIRQYPRALCERAVEMCKEEATDPVNLACAPLGRLKNTAKNVKRGVKAIEELRDLIKQEKRIRQAPRKSSEQLRKEWEEIHKERWPKDPKSGRNKDAHHEDPHGDGGKDHGRNIKPLTRQEHIDHHKRAGDYRRWGGRRYGEL